MAIINSEKYSLQRAGAIGHVAYFQKRKAYALLPEGQKVKREGTAG